MIPVHGVLMHGFPYQFGGLLTGYEYITAALVRGMNDPEVDEIALHIDSPGGMVSGCFDCAEAIYMGRGIKPITAIADEFAYSAAYALASAADEIVVARTGAVGSIGILATHVEMSRAIEERGFKVTLVSAGKYKTDGHSALPLSDSAMASMQERVDALYSMFVAMVARNRGLEEQAVRDTEAAVFMAPQAVEIGLADRLIVLDEQSASADASDNDEDYEMSQNDTSTVEEAVTPEALAAAVAEATATGEEAGRTAERERITAILDSDEAAERPALARALAMTPGMIPDAAAKLLAVAAPETAPDSGDSGSGSAFVDAMNSGQNPEVGGNDPDDGGKAATPRHHNIIATARRIGLAGIKKEAV